MKMTNQEYEELISHFEFIADKVESCYKREVDHVLERLKKDYKKHVVSLSKLK